MSATSTTPAIELRGLYKRFRTPTGDAYTALRNLSLTVQPGEFCAVVGPTSCGKSTTLTLIAGLEAASAGEVLIGDQPVEGIDPRIGYMFQTDAVFPWKDVVNNVAAGSLFRGVPKTLAFEQAHDWIRRVGLSGCAHHYPHQVSGGMRKRVALAQTLINNPQILLMDEPFSALDVQTRVLMEDELLGRAAWRRAISAAMAGASCWRKCAIQTAATALGDQGARARKRERPASERPKQTARGKPAQVAGSRHSSTASSTVRKYWNWGWLKQERKAWANWRKRGAVHIMGVGVAVLQGGE